MPLTERDCKAAKPEPKQFELRDGQGLSLLVTPAGAKIWRFRYRLGGAQRRITIGEYSTMSLARARLEAGDLRQLVRRGIDPAAPPEPAQPEPEVEPLGDAIERYLDEHRELWRPSTARTYGSAIAAFASWARAAEIGTVDKLTPRALSSFRADAIARPGRRKAKGKGVGRKATAETSHRRSADGINCELRAVRTLVEWMRRTGVVALSSDEIADNLRPVDGEVTRPRPLRPAQLRQLLAACERHDLEHEPVAALVITMLLAGLRLGEALRLDWADVDLDEQLIRVAPGKTKRERDVDLGVSPALARMFSGLRSRSSGLVFGWTQATALDARRRLIDEYGAPPFLWSTRHSRAGERSPPTLRSTCGCYLTCAPGIYGGASIYLAADRQGHSADVAQSNYLGALRQRRPGESNGIPTDATTLEAAMEIEAELERLLAPRQRLRVVE